MVEGSRVRLVVAVAMNVRWLAFEWLAERLDRERFELSFLLLGDGEPPLAPFLRQRGIPFVHLRYRGKRDLARCTVEAYRYCRAAGVDAIHTHFFPAHFAGLLGAWLAGVPLRVQTRHHSTFHYRYRRAAALYDRFFNALATRIVAPSEVVKRVLVEREGVDPRKVVRIDHGFALDRFAEVPAAEVAELAGRYLPPGAGPVVGVVARYIECKGVQHVIPAFRRLLASYPSAFLVLANARGGDGRLIRRELAALPAGSYVEIPFEPNVSALYKLFDLFVHAPVDPDIEAFGQVYVEALAAGVPAVVTRSGIGQEILEHGVNAWIVAPADSEAIHQGCASLLADPALRERLARAGERTVRERFSLERMMAALERLYLDGGGRRLTGPGGSAASAGRTPPGR